MRRIGLECLLFASAIGFFPARAASAADVGGEPAAPTTNDAAPVGAPASPAADTPKPMSAPPPPMAPAERSAKNAIYVEGLGTGLFYSLNYERVFGDFAPRIGFGYMSISASAPSASGTGMDSAHTSFVSIPMSVSYLGIGSLNHMFEVGAGATIFMVGEGATAVNVSASGSATMVLGSVTAGYRYQPADGGFLFRGGLNVMVGGAEWPVLPWPYIALGGTF